MPDHEISCSFNSTKTHLFKYIENFTTKNWKFSEKNITKTHLSKYTENFYNQKMKIFR